MYTFYVTWVGLLFITNVSFVGVFSYLSYAAYAVGWQRGGLVLGILSGISLYNLITVLCVIYLLIS